MPVAKYHDYYCRCYSNEEMAYSFGPPLWICGVHGATGRASIMRIITRASRKHNLREKDVYDASCRLLAYIELEFNHIADMNRYLNYNALRYFGEDLERFWRNPHQDMVALARSCHTRRRKFMIALRKACQSFFYKCPLLNGWWFYYQCPWFYCQCPKWLRP